MSRWTEPSAARAMPVEPIRYECGLDRFSRHLATAAIAFAALAFTGWWWAA